MYLVNTQTGNKEEAVIEPVVPGDYKTIKKSKRFPDFSWDAEKQNEVVKIRLRYSEEILGLMSLVDFSSELWIKINLLQTAVENVGKGKVFDRIAGCLIAYACRQAFLRGYGGMVALEPKTDLIDHYMDAYGMKAGGKHLYSELLNSQKLIDKFLK